MSDSTGPAAALAALRKPSASATHTAPTFDSQLDRLRSKVLTTAQLHDLPAPEPLVGSVLPVGSLAVAYGKPGSFKTFVALDMALCVATGSLWQGWRATQGTVLYVAAEGLAGLPKRIRAWEERRGVATPQDAFWLPEAVPLLNDNAIALVEAYVADLRPRLIVLDTLARCMAGGDENSAKDVGHAIENADRLRRAAGATVLLIHHTTKDGGSYRGSSALEGAVDVALEVTVEGDLVTVTCTKSKDAAPFEPIRLQAVPTGDSVTLKEWRHGDDLRAGEAKAVGTLAELFGDIDVSPAQWREACGYPNRNDNSFLRIRKALVEKGFVANVGTRQRPLYRITDNGCRHVANMSQTQNGDGLHVATTRHPLGMATGDKVGDKTSVIEAANKFLGLDADLF